MKEASRLHLTRVPHSCAPVNRRTMQAGQGRGGRVASRDMGVGMLLSLLRRVTLTNHPNCSIRTQARALRGSLVDRSQNYRIPGGPTVGLRDGLVGG